MPVLQTLGSYAPDADLFNAESTGSVLHASENKVKEAQDSKGAELVRRSRQKLGKEVTKRRYGARDSSARAEKFGVGHFWAEEVQLVVERGDEEASVEADWNRAVWRKYIE